jgi:hypothetical protein
MASHRLSDRQRAAREQEFNRDSLEREEQAALQDRRAATALVTIWNARRAAGRELWFHPTIGGAIAGGRPWLSFWCPACGQVGEVDLRTLGRHPGASIDSLVPALSCRRCRPNAPFAQLIRLAPRRGGR